jgi:predicted ArsR family transcriptional regulator
MLNEKQHSLQKEIIRLLAEKGPLTKYETAQSLEKSYKNIIFAFNSLQEKGLIKKTKLLKEYRGRKFEMFWLTPKGIVEAYGLGIPKETIQKIILDRIGENLEKKRSVEVFFKFLETLGSERVSTLIDLVDEESDVPKFKGIPLNLMSIKEAENLLRICMRYEPYRSILKELLQNFMNELAKTK